MRFRASVRSPGLLAGSTLLEVLRPRNPNVKVSAKVASNHIGILREDSPAVAQSVRDLAAAVCHAVG